MKKNAHLTPLGLNDQHPHRSDGAYIFEALSNLYCTPTKRSKHRPNLSVFKTPHIPPPPPPLFCHRHYTEKSPPYAQAGNLNSHIFNLIELDLSHIFVGTQFLIHNETVCINRLWVPPPPKKEHGPRSQHQKSFEINSGREMLADG